VYFEKDESTIPTTNQKFVIHKSEFQKMNTIDIYLFPT